MPNTERVTRTYPSNRLRSRWASNTRLRLPSRTFRPRFHLADVSPYGTDHWWSDTWNTFRAPRPSVYGTVCSAPCPILRRFWTLPFPKWRAENENIHTFNNNYRYLPSTMIRWWTQIILWCNAEHCIIIN